MGDAQSRLRWRGAPGRGIVQRFLCARESVVMATQTRRPLLVLCHSYEYGLSYPLFLAFRKTWRFPDAEEVYRSIE